MALFNLLALFCTAALAGVIPRSGTQDVPAGQCCFTLHDASTGKVVQQDQETGFLYLGSSQPNGWYCIDLSDTRDILWDDFNNACILTWPDEQFTCLDPTLGPNLWTLNHSGALRLSHDGGAGYSACSSSSGEILYSNQKTGCRVLQLKPQGLKGTCDGLS